MPLSRDQIQIIVQEKRNQKELEAGKYHQDRLRFHVETVLNKNDLSPYYHDFKRWISEEKPEILAEDKRDRFFQLLTAPIQTIELTESIFSRLYRIFNAQDSYFNYQFTDDSLEADWAEFCDSAFWSTQGFEAMQTAIDSVWVAELPAEQLTDFPQPKNKLIDIENVLAIKNDHLNRCEYVIFRLGDVVYEYDDLYLRAYNIEGEKIDPEPFAEVEHDLGYTPARMFWSENLQSKNVINKESPITKELSDLDWLLFHQVSKRHLDLVNAYPIIAMYESDDDFEDERITDNEQRTTKKKPKGHNLAGAGSLVEAPVPREGEPDLMRDPIKYINPPVDTLDWHVKEEKRLIEKIFKSVVGTDQEVKNDAAKNEMQIESSFESQGSVLMRVKKNFEKIHKFADATICKLRYGERFISCEIDYGTNFFLKDVGDLQDELTEAKKSGASEALIDSININMRHTKYRDDKRNLERASIIDDLDPLPGKSLLEAIDIYKEGGISRINFIIKSNLSNFIRRFERDNTDIVRFGSLTNYKRKIDQINESLKEYAQETLNIDTNETTIKKPPGVT